MIDDWRFFFLSFIKHEWRLQFLCHNKKRDFLLTYPIHQMNISPHSDLTKRTGHQFLCQCHLRVLTLSHPFSYICLFLSVTVIPDLILTHIKRIIMSYVQWKRRTEHLILVWAYNLRSELALRDKKVHSNCRVSSPMCSYVDNVAFRKEYYQDISHIWFWNCT